MKHTLLLLAILLVTKTISAQDGTVDTTFGYYGDVQESGSHVAGNYVLAQPDGKILVGASTGYIDYPYTIYRYNANGTADTSFNHSGRNTVLVGDNYDRVCTMAMQPGGSIIVTGISTGNNSYVALFRLTAHGIIDSSFGTYGIDTFTRGVTMQGNAYLAVQPNGKILLATEYQDTSNHQYHTKMVVVRYNANGRRDSTFNHIGLAVAPYDSIYTCGIAYDTTRHKIILGGTIFNNIARYAVLRMNEDGSMDSTFGTNGITKTDVGLLGLNRAYEMAVSHKGKIALVGKANNMSALAVYNADGTPDLNFNKTGTRIDSLYPWPYYNNNFNTVQIQKDGKIIAAGGAEYGSGKVIRYKTDGTIDSACGQNGIMYTAFNVIPNTSPLSSTLLEDGKLVVMGFRFGQPFAFDAWRINLLIDSSALCTNYNIQTIETTPATCAVNGSATLSSTPAYPTIASYLWNTTPVQTTATATNLPPGTYLVTAVDNQGCTITDSATVGLTGTGQPVANFTFSGAGFTLHFNNISVNSLYYQWYVSGQLISDSAIASYTFADTGTYHITLIVSNNCGSDTIINEIIITGTGISEVANAPAMRLVANPCSTCRVTGTGEHEKLVVSNTLGQAIPVSLVPLTGGYRISFMDNTPGIFFITNTSTGQTIKGIRTQ